MRSNVRVNTRCKRCQPKNGGDDELLAALAGVIQYDPVVRKAAAADRFESNEGRRVVYCRMRCREPGMAE